MRAGRPELRADALYEAAIARRLELDATAAHAFMRRVHDSHQDWETDRTPKFIDVVKYMVVSEYLARQPLATGMTLDLGAFLADRIDPRL